MAFGQISSTILISIGVPPAAASAGVHTAETFTTAVSAISHVAHQNVDWTLFFRLALPGIVGGVLGAYVLTTSRCVDGQALRARLSDRARPLPLLSRRHAPPHRAPAEDRVAAGPRRAASSTPRAAAAGAAIVTSNLLVQGSNPRKTIGTVNTAEFFLTVTISATFLATFTLTGSQHDKELLVRAIARAA